MPNDEQPNVLLVTTDTQRWDTLACMGNEHAVSPNLDRLAEEGVLFANAYTSSPVCSPARTGLITGTHTPIHGRIENGFEPHSHLPTVMDHLDQQGYTNILVGKTHFEPYTDSFDVLHRIREKMVDADDAYADHIREHGYDRISSHPNPIPGDLFIDSFIVDEIIEQIERHRMRDSPFFAFCSLISPHPPYDPPGEWQSTYDNVSLPPLNYSSGELADHPEHLKMLLGHDEERITELEAKLATDEGREEVEDLRRRYYSLAAYCDKQVGRLIEYLDRSGLREETFIIFSSDHGTTMFDHGFDDKHNYYDSTWRVPLIMSMPNTLPSGETREFAVWNDIATTILSVTGTSCETMQGFDLYTPLKHGNPSPRICAVGTLYKSAALVTEQWKFEYYFESGTGQLFNRKTDPNEQNNLYGNPQYETIRNELRATLLSWYTDLMDLHHLQEAIESGGPVAGRAKRNLNEMSGVDPERRLNERVEEIHRNFFQSSSV